jgi:diguanylate cyclase (GGDEF)-like protein
MKILLVEDVRSIATVMAARLGSFGHEVKVAENGKRAVAMFPEMAPDLVLMDIEMPEMNGFEAATHIRAIEAAQQWAWTPIMFLTASDTPENLVTAIEAGGDDFLAKAVPENVLHAKMKAMGRIAALRQRLAFANDRLHEQASRDGLTGLYNRRHMDLLVDAAWDEAARLKQPFAILMIDVDNFKKYNDRYGHQAGDEVLKRVARVLAQSARRPLDLVARYGGEEFVIVLYDTTRAHAAALAERIVDSVQGLGIANAGSGCAPVVTVSVGVAFVQPAPGRSPDGFVQLADAALYAAKDAGRNRVHVMQDEYAQLRTGYFEATRRESA